MHVRFDRVDDMRELYGQVHATVACFRPGFGKSCPNSVVEGFACGRPAIVAEHSGIASLVRATGSGAVTSFDVTHLSAQVDALARDWDGYARRARETAERSFDLHRFTADYRAVYAELLGLSTPAGEALQSASGPIPAPWAAGRPSKNGRS
jgi:glycosyltransferase involved in cell wall biosynthesis